MIMEISESEFYNNIRTSLIGKRISHVQYQELDYEDNLEYWEFSQSIHSVNMNVILTLHDKSIVQFNWDYYFDFYGVGIKLLESIDKREGLKTVSILSQHWKQVFNIPIKDVFVYWSESDSETQYFENDKLVNVVPEKIRLPQTLELQFENDESIFITAIEIKPRDVIYWSDHLTVLFDKMDFIKYGLHLDSKISVSEAVHKP